MYQVLYRKWRPKSFSDVVGQPQVTVTLQNQLKNNRISHAYLFTGSRGTGKTTCAKILAKAVNCLNPVDGNPCNECEICKAANNGSLMDIVEIDAASNNRVEDVRALLDEVAFNPNEAKYRVYIIDEVHMLSKSAFNALLKTLEEPPAHVVFILATTEVHELPATILSRCQRFDFNRINPRYIADRLIYVAEHENTVLEDDAAMLIAAVSDGALRDALSLLDRAISINSHVTADVVRQAAGIVSKEYLFEITESISAHNVTDVIKIVDMLHNNSKDAPRLCKELISHYRSLMLIKTMKNPFELVVMTNEEQERAKTLAESLPLEFITYAIATLQTSFNRMKLSADSRTELELSLVKLCTPELSSSNEALLARIAALETAVRNIHLRPAENIQKEAESKNNITTDEAEIKPEYDKNSGVFDENTLNTEADVNYSEASAKVSEISNITPAQKPKQPVDMKKLKENAVVFEGWGDVIQVIGMYSKAIALAFEDTTAYISGDYLLIDSDADIPFKLLRQSAQRDKIREAIKKVTGRVYKLGPYNIKEKEKKEDPLKDLMQKAQEVGINIVNTNENNN